MEFRILGPLQVSVDAGPVALSGRRSRTLLAVLLTHPGQVVAVDHLIDAVWDGRPPATAIRQVQNEISVLRRLLGDGAGGTGRTTIVADGRGYRAELRPGELDSEVFADGVARAQSLVADSQITEAAAELRAALRLWRGPALMGLGGRVVEAAAARLDEQRLTAMEQQFDLELRLGRHDDVVGDLTELVAANPLRERLVGQLMLALYRAGRQADALEVYHLLRVRLADELALDPGPPLQRQFVGILNSDPAAGAPRPEPTHPTPRQLPADVAGFTGRGEHLKQLDELLRDDGDRETAVVISAIAGTAGVGKTALAVRWGHRVSDRFPDGQLYVDLRGHARGEPVRSIDALTQFLRSLGEPAGEIPAEESAAAARYRSLLAERRVLVLLDNAADAAQVRPLLPASPGCLVLITSRHRLSDLVARDGARRLSLDVLGADEAQLLLVRILGGERVAAEPDAAAELARLCSYLPLALRIAAATLLDHPVGQIDDLVGELRRDPLSILETDGEHSGVRAAFELSYRALTADARRMFRLAGMVPGPDVTAEAAAALTGTTVPMAGRLLERLAGAHLVTEHRSGRYTSHDLLRQYAADQSRAEDTPALRRQALERLFDWYLHGADAAATVVYPDRLRLPVPPGGTSGPAFATDTAALAWLDAERANLVAAIVHTAEHGPRPTAWLLADTLRSYFLLRVHTVDLARATRAALRAAEAEDDLRAQAITLLSLSNLDHRQLRYADAVEHCTRARALAERAAWAQGQATALGILATVHRDAGRIEEAAAVYDQALTLYRQEGSRNGEALTLNHLARTYWYLGRFPEAIEAATHAVTLRRAAGSREGEAAALDTLGEICHAAGRLDEALAHLGQALTLTHEIDDRGVAAYTLRDLAEVHRDRGDLRQALDLARAALTRGQQLGDVRIEVDALNTLATVHHRLAHDREAIALHQQALELTGEVQERFPQIEAFIGLAMAWHGLGRTAQAIEYGRRALAAADRTGYQILEDRARAVLGRIAPSEPPGQPRPT
ncbi:AfsR/SARP family transcriptional regulator [Virgisporangium aurantiacum]|uniref:SARP family transcriptional regulator n=1 Tax=Virgisporangium aurantiacum TaxID=175570 RepID=A0A8J3ZHV1_9ACTN|nr:BTAD domain-containing putative transcriptional regulator [Virgisporangium aurantiacum]GIJ64096.1 SARP family transcriptional regulator [Virgisporangium aurantiacum]